MGTVQLHTAAQLDYIHCNIVLTPSLMEPASSVIYSYKPLSYCPGVVTVQLHTTAQLDYIHCNIVLTPSHMEPASIVIGLFLNSYHTARIKIGITFILRFHRHPIQLAVFVPVGLCRS